MERDNSVDSDIDVSSPDEASGVADKTVSRSKKNQVKVPKKINKARREKLKREQLNDLFLDLAKVLDIKEPNNGKACILTEATRFLSGMLVHVERLRKENLTLMSESQYVTVEKEELKEDNFMLLTEVEKLRGEIESKKLQSQPHLNAPPPEVQLLPQQASLLSKDHLGTALPNTTLGQSQLQCPILVFPFGSNYSNPIDDNPLNKNTSIVSKPCPLYPGQMGSWHSQILEEPLRVSKTS